MKTEPGLDDSKIPSTPQPRLLRKSWIAAAAVLIALVLLYFSLRGLNWNVFWQNLKQLNYWFLPLFFMTSSINYLFRALRWRILILSEKPVAVQDVFWANMAGYFGNNILPARAGELIRAIYLGKLVSISSSFVLATGLVERLMDVLALVIIGTVALSLTGIVSNSLRFALLIMTMAGVAGLIFLVLLSRFSSSAERLVYKIPFLQTNHKLALVLFLNQFVRGIQSLSNSTRILGFAALTVLIWLVDGLQTVGLAILFGFPLTLAQALVLLAGLGLSSAIPSTPGYVGVYQFVAITILVPFGLSRETALAFMLVSQIIGLLVVAFWGGFSFWKINRLNNSGDTPPTSRSGELRAP